MSGILQLVNTFPSGGFSVKNSLRFRSSASAYLSRTPSSTGNQKTFTFSAWVKRGQIGQVQALMSAPVAGGYPNFGIAFTASDQLRLFAADAGSTTIVDKVSSAVYRDPSAWYHVVVSANFASTQANLYVNGIQITSFATNTGPTNTACVINTSGVAHAIGEFSSTWHLDGYLAEINFIDGQALTPSSFGAFDATSGVWQPTKYSGTYGTNGFYLKFSDTTSTTTLCYDYSGNGNNWTPNNISLTSGSTYDSMLDSPTNYDNGGNGVGNYAVLNAVDTGRTLSNANLTYAGAASGIVKTTFGISSGKWYWEFTAGNTDCMTGLCAITLPSSTAWIGSSAGGWGYYGGTGLKYFGGSGSSYGASYTTNDVIGVAFDADAGTLTFYKNNTSQGTAFTGLTGVTYCPANGNNSTNDSGSFNFGQRPFAYTPPTGFKALNTQNLPAASIVNGASYMAATLYTGDSATSRSISNAVNGVSFQPGFVWVKQRNITQNHSLADIVRGPGYMLWSDATNAEYTATTYGQITSFDSGGFTASKGSDPTYSYYNISTGNYVAWQWKAGGTAVTNTAGSITSQVSANTTAGFSVATFTCNAGGSGTFGHGLGVAPSMVIIKSRTNGVQNWVVGCSAIAWTNYLLLNQTGASAANSTVWNNTAPSSTVVTLGSGFTNANYGDCVAYCFAAIPGYSAFGSFVGNGSSDGPFIYCGFRPRWILGKNISTNGAGNWFIQDTSRSPYNAVWQELYPNSSSAETTSAAASDNNLFLSNGFKAISSGGGWNQSGETYIYAAFAENPLKYSLAR